MADSTDATESTDHRTPRTFSIRNDGDTPLFVDAYPGFRITRGETDYPRWTCEPQCGICDFGECGCAPNTVSQIMPGETIELDWDGEYWQQGSDDCNDTCAIRQSASQGTYTVSLDHGSEMVEQGGCVGTSIGGEVGTVIVEFEHPAADVVEVVIGG